MTEPEKSPLVRFSVAIGESLLDQFDTYLERHGHANRSEAVRSLIRTALIDEAVADDQAPAMGVVTLVYDHHAAGIADRLTEVQHHHLDCVVTTTHVHLDARRCLEVVLLRGAVQQVRHLAEQLIGTKGVETGRLVLTAAEPVDGPASHHHPTTHHHPPRRGPSRGHGHDHARGQLGPNSLTD